MREAWTLFAVAAAVRLVALLVVPTYVPDDGRAYLEIGANLAAGHGISYDVDPTGTRTGVPVPVGMAPVLPVLVALARTLSPSSLVPLQVMQIALSSLMAPLLALLGNRLAGAGAGWLVGLAAAIYPPFVFESLTIQQEHLMMVFLVLAAGVTVIAIERDRLGLFLAAGIVLGLAVLTKETLLYFPLFFALVRLVPGPGRRRRLAQVAVLGVGVVVAVAPWAARNRLVLGANPAYLRAPLVAKWQQEEAPLRWIEGALMAMAPTDRVLTVREHGLGLVAQARNLAFPEVRTADGQAPPSIASKSQALAIEWGKIPPLQPDQIALLEGAERRTFLRPYGVYFWDVVPGLPTVWVLIGKGFVYLLYALAIAGALATALRAETWRDPRLLFLVSCGLYVGLATLIHATPMNRFFHPVVPVLMLLAAPTYARLLRAFRVPEPAWAVEPTVGEGGPTR